MNTVKLTLSIPKKLLMDAKAYSQKTHQPLSRLVARYFALLARHSSGGEGEKDNSEHITRRVKNVTGIAKSSQDEKEILFEQLTRKYR